MAHSTSSERHKKGLSLPVPLPSSPESSEDQSEITLWGLSLSVKQQLLRDIEKLGGLSVVKVARLCDAKPHLYGEKDSRLRRQVQNKVGKWKLLSSVAFDKVKRDVLKGVDEPPTPPIKQDKRQRGPISSLPRSATKSRAKAFSPFSYQGTPSQSSRPRNMAALPWENVQFGPGT